MAEKQYFFKNAAGEYILGTNKKNAVPPGHYSRSVNEVGGVEMLALINMHDKDDIKYPVPASHYLKEDGTAYGSVDEIIVAVSGFFFSVAAEGGGGGVTGGGFGIARLTGNGGADYPAPADLKVSGELFALNPQETEVTALMVGDVATIRFAVAPIVDEFPLIVYTKK